jgi:hypothetical protein
VIELIANLGVLETEMNASASSLMLAEKFFLVLETLRSHASDDRPEIVTSPARPPAVPEIATGWWRRRSVPDERRYPGMFS